MPINLTDPDIITIGNRLTSFNWLYVNVPRKLTVYTFTSESIKHLGQVGQGNDAIEVEALIYAKMVK